MKKKTRANLIMVTIILLIALTGVLCVGMIKGWFDQSEGGTALLSDLRGNVEIQRNGVRFPAKDATVLRAGDGVFTGSGSTCVIKTGDDHIAVNGSTQLTVKEPTANKVSVEVVKGEVFVSTTHPIELVFAEREVTLSDTAAALSVRSSAQTLRVFRGNVGDAPAGQAIEYLSGQISVRSMQLGALNDFLIAQIRLGNQSSCLCFTNADLDALADQRQQAIQDLLDNASPSAPMEPAPILPPVTEPTSPPETKPAVPPQSDPAIPPESEPTVPPQTEPAIPPESEPTVPAQTEPAIPPESEPTAPPQTEPAIPPETEPTVPPQTELVPPTLSPGPRPAGSCHITIRCDTILQNMDDLEPGKAEFVPTDGIILPVVKVDFFEGETVFDVLRRVCETLDIQLEYSWTPLYDSYYIEGIHHLYEFDCGFESGWMYKVNEWFPNYGCSSYPLTDGDVIVWCYTCVGLGTDVGAKME